MALRQELVETLSSGSRRAFVSRYGSTYVNLHIRGRSVSPRGDVAGMGCSLWEVMATFGGSAALGAARTRGRRGGRQFWYPGRHGLVELVCGVWGRSQGGVGNRPHDRMGRV
jgi:hypothetical protein